MRCSAIPTDIRPVFTVDSNSAANQQRQTNAAANPPANSTMLYPKTANPSGSKLCDMAVVVTSSSNKQQMSLLCQQQGPPSPADVFGYCANTLRDAAAQHLSHEKGPEAGAEQPQEPTAIHNIVYMNALEEPIEQNSRASTVHSLQGAAATAGTQAPTCSWLPSHCEATTAAAEGNTLMEREAAATGVKALVTSAEATGVAKRALKLGEGLAGMADEGVVEEAAKPEQAETVPTLTLTASSGRRTPRGPNHISAELRSLFNTSAHDVPRTKVISASTFPAGTLRTAPKTELVRSSVAHLLPSPSSSRLEAPSSHNEHLNPRTLEKKSKHHLKRRASSTLATEDSAAGANKQPLPYPGRAASTHGSTAVRPFMLSLISTEPRPRSALPPAAVCVEAVAPPGHVMAVRNECLPGELQQGIRSKTYGTDAEGIGSEESDEGDDIIGTGKAVKWESPRGASIWHSATSTSGSDREVEATQEEEAAMLVIERTANAFLSAAGEKKKRKDSGIVVRHNEDDWTKRPGRRKLGRVTRQDHTAATYHTIASTTTTRCSLLEGDEGTNSHHLIIKSLPSASASPPWHYMTAAVRAVPPPDELPRPSLGVKSKPRHHGGSTMILPAVAVAGACAEKATTATEKAITATETLLNKSAAHQGPAKRLQAGDSASRLRHNAHNGLTRSSSTAHLQRPPSSSPTLKSGSSSKVHSATHVHTTRHILGVKLVVTEPIAHDCKEPLVVLASRYRPIHRWIYDNLSVVSTDVPDPAPGDCLRSVVRWMQTATAHVALSQFDVPLHSSLEHRYYGMALRARRCGQHVDLHCSDPMSAPCRSMVPSPCSVHEDRKLAEMLQQQESLPNAWSSRRSEREKSAPRQVYNVPPITQRPKKVLKVVERPKLLVGDHYQAVIPSPAVQLPPSPTAEELQLMGSMVYDITNADDMEAASICAGGDNGHARSNNRVFIKEEADLQQQAAAGMSCQGMSPAEEKLVAAPFYSYVGGTMSFKQGRIKHQVSPSLLLCEESGMTLSYPSHSNQAIGRRCMKKLSREGDLHRRHSIMDATVKELDCNLGEKHLKLLGMTHAGFKAQGCWTPREEDAFAAGIKQHDREFELIQRDQLPQKSMSQLICYYYNVWKLRYTQAANDWHVKRKARKSHRALDAAGFPRSSISSSDDDEEGRGGQQEDEDESS
ncbi:hypothetical protein CEUSTIGMA_g2754.t1 [Chlamydomonas eustigma]|uniref:SANT domain-containing protein n=1 Tax=Chlamydomonas eustigma TaxID=1157962 RepID=A0A250WX84_9CHLO|nr:hypothetical protein CEUSTIGMA_g2754.t1 [Chlamydomonas eustigma]|eukprot:GAX75309.1 hypothetical protein CEUSTIGMA_g2754.t1 [Chlamydomonas eustigma]